MTKLFAIFTGVFLTACAMNQEQCVHDFEPLTPTQLENIR